MAVEKVSGGASRTWVTYVSMIREGGIKMAATDGGREGWRRLRRGRASLWGQREDNEDVHNHGFFSLRVGVEVASRLGLGGGSDWQGRGFPRKKQTASVLFVASAKPAKVHVCHYRLRADKSSSHLTKFIVNTIDIYDSKLIYY
jgi:hypothetical protein